MQLGGGLRGGLGDDLLAGDVGVAVGFGGLQGGLDELVDGVLGTLAPQTISV